MTNKDRNNIKGSKKAIVDTGKKTLRILLAEDDDEMRNLLAESLHGEGYDIVECPNGLGLLMSLRDYIVPPSGSPKKEFDLVISDIRMPGVTGLEILEGLHHVGDCPPIILITAFGDSATHQRAEQCGVAAMFDKPFDMNELLGKVQDIALAGNSM